MAPPNVEALRRMIVRSIRALGKPGGDPKAQKYLGSPFPVLGLSSPQMQGIVREFVRGQRDLDSKSVNSLVGSLWKGKALEEKWAAISILSRYSKVWTNASWRIVDRWIDDAVGWGV